MNKGKHSKGIENGMGWENCFSYGQESLSSLTFLIKLKMGNRRLWR